MLTGTQYKTCNSEDCLFKIISQTREREREREVVPHSQKDTHANEHVYCIIFTALFPRFCKGRHNHNFKARINIYI